MSEQVLCAVEVALPRLRQATQLILPSTPVTFRRYTRRSAGWVWRVPTGLVAARPGAWLAPSLWQVGDSIFPGQSTAAVALGGMRVARAILDELWIEPPAEWAGGWSEPTLAARTEGEAA
jgi:hypothetical protein